MKRLLILFVIAIQSLGVLAYGGIPFFANYTSDVYKAHNRNFDIVCDDYGSVFIANFEGILYYDQAQWRIIHTPGISRVTSLFKDSKGRIWVGGYNVFGYLSADARGMLQLKVLHSDTSTKLLGEVSAIAERDGYLVFNTSDHVQYQVRGDKIIKVKGNITKDNISQKTAYGFKINQTLAFKNGWNLYASAGKGLVVDESHGKGIYELSELNGLCNNNVNHITYDGKGGLWGATDKGLFCASMPSVFTHSSASEGLIGEVTAIDKVGDQIYVGTMQGLFIKKVRHFYPIPNVTQTCWQLQQTSDGQLFAATSDGLFHIKGNVAQRMNKNLTLSVLYLDAAHIYTGELDGLYLNSSTGSRTKIADIDKVNNIVKGNDGTLWIETVYGQVYFKQPTDRHFMNVAVKAHFSQDNIVTICDNNGKVSILNNKGLYRWDKNTKVFRLGVIPSKYHFANYPQFIYYDKSGRAWQTNSEGRTLGVARNGKRLVEYDSWLNPLRDLVVNAVCVRNNEIWIGGDFGMIHWDINAPDVVYNQKSKVYIRSIILGKDSVIWGGYNNAGHILKPQIDETDIKFGSDNRAIRFVYSSDHASIFGKTEYRYRLVGYSDWSAWTTETDVDYQNLYYGHYEFQVMARDRYGRITDTVSYPFSIQYPLYLRWYTVIVYVLLFALLIMQLIRFRMQRLLKEKMHLEKIVEERTSELRQRNDEVVEKSKSLEKALDDLGNAQNELIHQEKMATVGKLTKGLIDRILNPMNYINNFSHLSIGLIKDVKEDIDDDKEKMTPDIYDDTMDVLSMVDSNLAKIEQHGMNTTRILKAMEEMLKERKGKFEPIVVSTMCSKILEIASQYHADLIKKYGIKMQLNNCPDNVVIEANAEQLHKTLMSFADNSIYAVAKKYEHNPYQPEMRLTVETEEENVKIRLYDNGIGIEDTIIESIFDPFFTTKTTGEAAGVGLYLSKEIINDIGGTISVQSAKDEYTEFIITIPIKHD